MKKVLPLAIACVVVIALLVLVLTLPIFAPEGGIVPSPKTPGAGDTPGQTSSPVPTGETAPPSEVEESAAYTVEGGQARLSLTVSGKTFDVAETAAGRRFALKSDPDVFIEARFLPETSAAAASPAFLDQYIDYMELETSGKNYIPGTDVLGETVTGYRSERVCAAWLIDVEGGVLAVTVSYKGDQIPQELQDALGTLTVENPVS